MRIIENGFSKTCKAPYRFGYNGKEKDDEVKGSGNQYDYDHRTFDPRLGRFFSVDPAAAKYPMLSPYCFAANSPIRFVDVDGLGPGDRIKKASSFIGTKYSQKPQLNRGSELRTGTSAAALEYIDCSELVCRVMAADEITKNVSQKGTVDLVKYLNNDDKFESSKNAPEAGDIFLWSDVKVDKKGNTTTHGHTGIVESVDDDGTIHTIEAYGEKQGTRRVERVQADFEKHSGWKGFFRPKVETPDGKLDPKPNTQNETSGSNKPIQQPEPDEGH